VEAVIFVRIPGRHIAPNSDLNIFKSSVITVGLLVISDKINYSFVDFLFSACCAPDMFGVGDTVMKNRKIRKEQENVFSDHWLEVAEVSF
jgi:hypothetical protein